ncbi:hypothetical protein R1sor_025026 [Riccia sorocarpa]|uniref:Methylosome subunit pICln n=1 Tax=Riccia sorocarpa TaxID=122646 RepID=A0ABD3G7F7_9MARC
MMETGLVAVTERAADGGEGPLQQNGTLYITTRRLIWLSNDDLQKGYAVTFLSLSMHAISRDTNAYPLPCIYTQIETGGSDSEYEEADDMEEVLENDENHVEDDFSSVQEMRVVPRDPSILDQIFQVLCDCALLNPDPEGGMKSNFIHVITLLSPEQNKKVKRSGIFNVNEVFAGRHIGEDDKPSEVPDIGELQIHDPRFEDAEEELEEGNGY